MLKYNPPRGFSLIEMMVTLVILAILIVIALPNYSRYVLKSHRSDGMAMLNEIMQAQERYAAANNTYVTTLSTLGYAESQLSPEGHYLITAGSCATGGVTACVKLTATAVGNQANDKNNHNGNLSLTSRGSKEGW